MITEFTLFTTLAFHHLIIGVFLILLLMVLNKLVKTSAEMRSWIWMTAFITATLVPFSLLSPPTPNKTNLIQNQLVDQSPMITLNSENAMNNNVSTITPTTSWHIPSEIVFEFGGLLRLFVFIWLCGSFWRSISVFRSYLRTHKLIKTSQPYTLSGDLFKQPNQHLYVSDLISSPLVAGYLSPKIILPKNIITNLNAA